MKLNNFLSLQKFMDFTSGNSSLNIQNLISQIGDIQK